MYNSLSIYYLRKSHLEKEPHPRYSAPVKNPVYIQQISQPFPNNKKSLSSEPKRPSTIISNRSQNTAKTSTPSEQKKPTNVMYIKGCILTCSFISQTKKSNSHLVSKPNTVTKPQPTADRPTNTPPHTPAGQNPFRPFEPTQSSSVIQRQSMPVGRSSISSSNSIQPRTSLFTRKSDVAINERKEEVAQKRVEELARENVRLKNELNKKSVCVVMEGLCIGGIRKCE